LSEISFIEKKSESIARKGIEHPIVSFANYASRSPGISSFGISNSGLLHMEEEEEEDILY
jgi:hypothetical protein